MFGKRRRKAAKQRAEWDTATAALLDTPGAASGNVAPPVSEPTLETAAQPPAPPEPPSAPTPPLAPELTTPLVEPVPVATEPPEPPPVRYFAAADDDDDDAPTAPSSDEPTPAFRFTPVDAPAPQAEPESESEPELGAGNEAAVQPPAVRLTGSELVALPDGNRALAERMRASQHEMAQLSMHMDAWMDQAAELRTELIVEWDADGLRPSYTDFVVRAVARSLVRHPYLNGALRDDAIELLTDVNVGITTPMNDDVSVRVIGDADQRSLKEIVAASPRVGEEPNTTVEEPEPTFVVASLGEYGVDSFTPVVLAPNVATLGIGRVRDETRWEGDRPVRTSMMTLVLSWDHRAFGGVTAAEFLVEVREMLEQPYRLLVD